MSEYSDILAAMNSMKKDKFGRVSEHQTRGKAPDMAESQGEIVDVINSYRSVCGKSILTEEDIEKQREVVSDTNSRISKAGVSMYAKLVK